MKLKLPDSYVILLYIIIIGGIASYIIPSGIFDRQLNTITGITYVVPNSYHLIEQTPVSVIEIFKAIPLGMLAAADIIIFVLIAGGSFGIIQATGVINGLIGSVTKKIHQKEKIMIPVLMIVFSLGGAILGTAEEILPLIPIFIALAIGIGFDAMTGLAIVFLGTLSGFIAGFLNPFSTGTAQKIAELPLFSGFMYRVICYIVILVAAILFVTYKANNAKKNPVKIDEENNFYQGFGIHKFPALTRKHIYITITLICGFIFLIHGTIEDKFSIMDIATLFLMMGIISGIIGKFKPNRIVTEFINGASNILYGTLIIGLARGIFIIMSTGNIIDTIISYFSHIVSIFSPVACAISMFIVHIFISLFIPSATGEASATMPIMIALADLSSVTRQTAVLAYQFGEGITYMVNPTSGYLMAVLAISGVSWSKWVKWVYPLFIIWFILGCVLITISVMTGYGPY
ncbi:C4-dicarboxylate ABC transporter permease [Clostridium sp.]|uniref:YfcC family protein n=1 Tax=Clostridium sp. TaxID=1506 RepID=UPI001A55E694|nr:C4-dicarboxylate ABC transporter permease [Clostridium sp.]MBK5235836.1 YfcC family protein [Clostridium sp.]